MTRVDPGGSGFTGNTYPVKTSAVAPDSASGYSASQIEALLSSLNPAAVAQAGSAHTAAGATLADIADALNQHAQVLSDSWQGTAAQHAITSFQQLQQTASDLAQASAKTGSVLSWLGETIFPFYKSYKPPGNGILGDIESFFGHNPQDTAARQVMARLNNRLVQANTNMPDSVSKNLPQVNAPAGGHTSNSAGGGPAGGGGLSGSGAGGGAGGIGAGPGAGGAGGLGGGSGPGGGEPGPTIPGPGGTGPGGVGPGPGGVGPGPGGVGPGPGGGGGGGFGNIGGPGPLTHLAGHGPAPGPGPGGIGPGPGGGGPGPGIPGPGGTGPGGVGPGPGGVGPGPGGIGPGGIGPGGIGPGPGGGGGGGAIFGGMPPEGIPGGVGGPGGVGKGGLGGGLGGEGGLGEGLGQGLGEAAIGPDGMISATPESGAGLGTAASAEGATASEAAAAQEGGMPTMMGGGAAGDRERERQRQAWMAEDADVWEGGTGSAPPLIGS